jgi:hypothetical protein
MSIRFDEKGKFFTDIVSKDSIPVIIQTIKHRIQGKIHIHPGKRLKDEINSMEKFFAVTEATIFAENGEKLYECEFFTLNREYILWLLPEEEIVEIQPTLDGGDS